MPLDFVGMDPDSQLDKCPAVHVDPITGDGLFVGKTVTDPLTIAEMARHGSIGADEAVIRMPARMWPIIGEAATGTYKLDRHGPGRVSFADLIAATRHSAVHLEMRDGYEPDNPGFLAWKASEPFTDDSHDRWRELVSGAVARGVRFRRARIVTEPLTDYVRFEYELTGPLNIAAGEQVRWLPRRQALGLMLPAHDFWLFDNRLLRFHHFLADDRIDDQGDQGDSFTSDPAVVTACIAAFETVWDRAIPHEAFTPA
jgi:hypothetical protein